MVFIAYNGMMKKLLLFIIISIFPIWSFAVTPILTVMPDKVIQGEPVMVTVDGLTGTTTAIRKISFDGGTVGVFSYQGKPTALIGIDLKKKPADYKLAVTLTDGTSLSKIISVGARPKISAPLGIPEKLGGNTPESAVKLVSSLARENQLIYSVRSFAKTLWTEPFQFPIPNRAVTDSYGYSRQIVGQSITHKGTDFRAKENTAVSAMNRGIVRLVRTLPTYGKTIIIDHGLGLFTLYMHLSKIKVNEGELVKAGQLIGLSGQTGYAENPHLHISVWIGKISIDPVKFMALFQ